MNTIITARYQAVDYHFYPFENKVKVKNRSSQFLNLKIRETRDSYKNNAYMFID